MRIFQSVSPSELLMFTRHLSAMLKSGVPITESLEDLSHQRDGSYFSKILKHIQAMVVNGQELHRSLAVFPHVFSKFYVQLIRVGELSGNLEKNLDFLAEHLRKEHEFSVKIKGILLYPTIVLTLAFSITMALSLFVLPRLIDLFASLDVELPVTTQILLWFALVMKLHGITILFGFVIALVFLRIITLQERIKPIWHTCLFSLPVAGIFFQNVELAQVFRNIGIMLSSGIPILDALDTQKDSMNNAVYKTYMKQLHKGVVNGNLLSDMLRQHAFPFIPSLAKKMIQIGERTGKLADTCMYLGSYFDEEVDVSSKNFSSMFEPIILIIIGVVVGFIAISIIGPIYQFTGSIQG